MIQEVSVCQISAKAFWTLDGNVSKSASVLLSKGSFLKGSFAILLSLSYVAFLIK